MRKSEQSALSGWDLQLTWLCIMDLEGGMESPWAVGQNLLPQHTVSRLASHHSQDPVSELLHNR